MKTIHFIKSTRIDERLLMLAYKAYILRKVVFIMCINGNRKID